MRAFIFYEFVTNAHVYNLHFTLQIKITKVVKGVQRFILVDLVGGGGGGSGTLVGIRRDGVVVIVARITIIIQ